MRIERRDGEGKNGFFFSLFLSRAHLALQKKKSSPVRYATYAKHWREVECMRITYEPLFKKYGVDVAINGHDHSYDRSYPTCVFFFFFQGRLGKTGSDRDDLSRPPSPPPPPLLPPVFLSFHFSCATLSFHSSSHISYCIFCAAFFPFKKTQV